MINWFRRLFGMKEKEAGPCHISYPENRDPRMVQGIAYCMGCGELHVTKPKIRRDYIVGSVSDPNY